MNLSAHQRWLLELVVDLRYPVSIFSHPEVELALNRKVPKWSPHALAELLDDLGKEGLVFFERAERRLTPGPSELTDWIVHDSDVTYGLTASGGAIWEAAARPKWDRYLPASSDGSRECEAICADPKRLEAFVRSPWQRWAPEKDSERWDTLQPWMATYWGKSLPLAHRARWSYLAGPRSQERLIAEVEQRAAFNAWLRDMDDWFSPLEI